MSANEKSANPEDGEIDMDERQSPRGQRPKRAAPRGRVSSGLALILAFVALLGAGYLWYTLIYQRPELTQMNLPRALADAERTIGEVKTALEDAEDQIRALTETQNTLRTAVESMRAEFGRNQAQWIVNEAEQLLLIANRRLQLARDVRSALAALRAADHQLELLADPALLPARREIAKEITQLESLERADIPGIALRLGSLAETIEQLPLAPDLRARGEQLAAANASQGASEDKPANSIWRDLLSLVRIRRHDTAQRPLLAPEQQYFARENLRLMLYGAQHALLQGFIATYQQNLATASRWLRDYYDQGAAAVEAVQQEIDKLRATPMMTELPDITASLELLRKASSRPRGP